MDTLFPDPHTWEPEVHLNAKGQIRADHDDPNGLPFVYMVCVCACVCVGMYLHECVHTNTHTSRLPLCTRTRTQNSMGISILIHPYRYINLDR